MQDLQAKIIASGKRFLLQILFDVVVLESTGRNKHQSKKSKDIEISINENQFTKNRPNK